jgi:hypothetical protein
VLRAATTECQESEPRGGAKPHRLRGSERNSKDSAEGGAMREKERSSVMCAHSRIYTFIDSFNARLVVWGIPSLHH